MIEFRQGNIFESGAEAIVNTVNTVGVMGAGLALETKKLFPQAFRAYRKAWARNELQIGVMTLYWVDAKHATNWTGPVPKVIIHFPTKKHWRDPSKDEYIISGLGALISVIDLHKIKSIAIPALGCGNGGLDWKKVHDGLEGFAELIPHVQVIVYEPQEKKEVCYDYFG